MPRRLATWSHSTSGARSPRAAWRSARRSPGATPQPAQPVAAVAPQATPAAMQLPLATVPLLNVHVLRVDREQKQMTTTDRSGNQKTVNVEGNVSRIYIELDPGDATIVGFLL